MLFQEIFIFRLCFIPELRFVVHIRHLEMCLIVARIDRYDALQRIYQGLEFHPLVIHRGRIRGRLLLLRLMRICGKLIFFSREEINCSSDSEHYNNNSEKDRLAYLLSDLGFVF